MKKITRKTFVKGIAAATISLPFFIKTCTNENIAQEVKAPGIITGKKHKWKMVTTWPPNFPILGESCNLYAKWVNEMSGGRIEIKVFGGGELVPALEAFDTVRSGAAEIGSGASYYWAGKAPATQFFASVPFGMNAQQLNTWIISGGGMELWEELYAGFNLIPLLAGNTGVQMGGWFNREIQTIDDLKGLKMRIPGLGGKVLERAGGAAVLLAGGEIYTGLERGIIDATEWLGPFHDYKMGFHQIAKYYYTPGWHEPGTALEFFLNKEKFEKLPNDLQMILKMASYRVNNWVLSELEKKNAEYLKILIEKENVDIKRFPSEVLKKLKQITEEIVIELTEKDAFSKKVYDSYSKFQKDASHWSSITEKVYYEDILNI